LERLLRIPAGTVAARAAARLERVNALVADYAGRLLAEGEDPFWVDDKERLKREDYLRRPFVLLPDALPDEVVRLVELDEEGTFRGLRLEPALVRRYPQGDLMPQAIGYAQPLLEGEYQRYRAAYGDEITLETRVGRAGLELTFDGLLRGRPGRRRTARDAEGAFTLVREETPPQPGLAVRLGVSVEACRVAEAAIERWAVPSGYGAGGRPSGGLVLMDARTGEILAWGEAPRFHLEEDLGRVFDPAWNSARFDPGTREWVPAKELPAGETLESWRAWLSRPDSLVLSRVAEIPLEPGSTMKPLTALAMMCSEQGLPWDHYDCRGGPGYPHCHHGGHGVVDLVEAIERSCNRYFAWALGESALWPAYRTSVAAYMDRLGFGHRVFADLDAGRRPGTAGRGVWLRREEWREGEVPTIGLGDRRFVAIGQGSVTVTPIHLARAYAVFANGGRLVTPHLVRAVGGEATLHPVTDLGIPETTLRPIREGLRRVVEGAGGTASGTDWSGVAATVYGKTGTSQVGRTYRAPDLPEGSGPWHHWFAGFAEAPGRAPVAFACVLYARNEGAAGATAAPAVAEFLRWWFAREEE
jgi:penicillin-binding protein 2